MITMNSCSFGVRFGFLSSACCKDRRIGSATIRSCASLGNALSSAIARGRSGPAAMRRTSKVDRTRGSWFAATSPTRSTSSPKW